MGIRATVAYLRYRLPLAQLAVMTLLPRADCRTWAKATDYCAQRKRGTLPGPMTESIDRVNDRLVALYGASAVERVHLLQCHGLFITHPGQVDPELSPDFLHPSLLGYKKLALECLLPFIRRWL